ncbi:relaxase/mobilization nuclease domain-containing protein [Bradyrhizobium sp. CCBAU 51745]|uniref:relaxase/mobilization nuclease domain-containing protein n=1 Tax=Bradyrhizobium sp. CCBAU 51745 TaxID=1325099 RepID=UPI002306DAE4|nr:hypothetical protein [Bradyrhizobium sp. CCBAU 51745]
MIIKSKRIRARGSALKRAIAHIRDGEDNDYVLLVRGNLADLEDARGDALRFGKQYCVRHWILSPDQTITSAQREEAIDRLAAEFEFDPECIVVFEHTKDRAIEGGGCAQHFHVLVPEVDPVSGRVMSSAHDYDRQSKIARVVEVAWGHHIVAAPRMQSIVAALEEEGDLKTAAALQAVTPPDHAASFSEADHQRAKRSGIDLPRVREMVAQALASATSRNDFENRLAGVGLRLRSGDEKNIPIVETVDGELVGSLARLVRLRKAALAERLTFNAAGKLKASAEYPAGDLPIGAQGRSANRAALEIDAGGGQSERRRPDRHDDRTPPTDGRRDRRVASQVGGVGSPPGRRDRDERDQKLRARLKLAAGGVRHTGALLDLLGAARCAALPPLQRVISGLDGVVERETVALQVSQLAEPASLLAARRKVKEAASLVRSLEEKADRLTQSIARHPSQSIWTRLFGTATGPDRRSLEIRLDGLKDKIATAGAGLSAARLALRTEEKKFQTAQVRHQAALPDRRAHADRQIAAARLARSIAERSPRCARWGAARLFAIAAALQTARARMQHIDEPWDDWEPSFDLWGIPRLPPPKIF